jgi:hypothetical protein
MDEFEIDTSRPHQKKALDELGVTRYDTEHHLLAPPSSIPLPCRGHPTTEILDAYPPVPLVLNQVPFRLWFKPVGAPLRATSELEHGLVCPQDRCSWHQQVLLLAPTIVLLLLAMSLAIQATNG